ncbi:MAG: hypothetical protein F4W95_12330 [Chloroflexi bacterium]|nr:hypothetical protein [Chloroflexota bacterium]MYD49253.1 hypothetical protein [Chloroflexota bacterium]
MPKLLPMKAIIAIAIAAVLFALACQPETITVEIPADTSTPAPTYTPMPTLEPLATHTPAATYTPYPTYTLYPTYTPVPEPTATPKPTPTRTRAPTFTPRPTITPRPTVTQRPTNTPVPTIADKWNIKTILGVEDAHSKRDAVVLDRLVIIGCYTGVEDYDAGKKWYTFSRDGSFSKKYKFIAITGLSQAPRDEQCYEMAMKYKSKDEYCYWIEYSNLPRPNIPGHCSGWEQETREFQLIHSGAWRLIPKGDWARMYQKDFG